MCVAVQAACDAGGVIDMSKHSNVALRQKARDHAREELEKLRAKQNGEPPPKPPLTSEELLNLNRGRRNIVMGIETEGPIKKGPR